MKQAAIFYQNRKAGVLTEDADGLYNKEYLSSDNARAVSLTLPLCETPYQQCNDTIL